MPANVTAEYKAAELEYTRAKTTKEKIAALQKMLREVPKHKGSEKLQADIKSKLAKFRALLKKEAQLKKKAHLIAIKKEGTAQVVLVGTTNSGKSTLLNELTGAKAEIAPYPFTTKMPEIGIMDYKGVKIQIIEIPAIVENFYETERGPTFLGIIRNADLIVMLFNSDEERELITKELFKAEIDLPIVYYYHQDNIKDLIWQRLGLIKVFTKEHGKKSTGIPFALKRGSTVRDLAEHIHKDFIRKFRYAKIWGKSAAFPGQQVGLDHILEDDDIVQIYLK